MVSEWATPGAPLLLKFNCNFLKMNKIEFVQQLSEFCEFGKSDFSVDTELKSIEGYDSMAIMSMIAFIDENFSAKISAVQIMGLSDFASLISLIGDDKFDHD